MNLLKVSTLLQSPSLDGNHGLNPLLAAALNKRGFVPRMVPSSHDLWGPEHYGLQKTLVFHHASCNERRSILGECGRHLLEEAYFIEKAGMAFTAKMVLLSESTQERMLYCLFAAEEADHLRRVQAYYQPPEASRPNSFLELIAEVIENGAKPGLTYIIQVVLEGWGISHYQGLARDCREEGLSRILKGIIKDEALHHGSGVVLFNNQSLTRYQSRSLVELMVRLFRMVQAGPQAVVLALERVKGHFSRSQRTRLFRELECEAQTLRRLKLLFSLMSNVQAAPILEALERYDVMRPWSPEECAALTF